MTYLFKLARRTAHRRALPLLFAAALAGCNTDGLTNSGDDPAGTPVPSTPEFATSFRGGIPFGTWALPTSYFGEVYNGAMRNIWPQELLDELAAIKSRGGKVILAFAGNEDYFQDGNDHFNLSMWKERVDRFKGINFNSYLDDGTIIGHYIIDEPNDPYNWGGQPVPGSMVETMAAYSKQLWPKLATIVRVEPRYLAQTGGPYKYLDAAWAQYTARKGDAGDYIAENVADAQKIGVALVTGLNIIKGSATQGEMSASMVQSAGSALLANSYPCAFLSWEYDERYLSRSDIKSAMSVLSQKAEAHPTRSCGSAPTALPSIDGIALSATKALVDGDQIVTLTWSGAAGSSVDLYRNGSYARTTQNDGRALTYPQRIGTYTYKICEAGKNTCSNSVSVTIK